MSDTKQWIDHETVEVTKTEVVSARLSLSGAKNNIEVLKAKIQELEADLAVKKEALAASEKELVELETLPNRPEAIIDPLFVAEKPVE